MATLAAGKVAALTVNLHVSVEVRQVSERPSTNFAAISFDTQVKSQVLLQVGPLVKRLGAELTGERPRRVVDPNDVNLKIVYNFCFEFKKQALTSHNLP